MSSQIIPALILLNIGAVTYAGDSVTCPATGVKAVIGNPPKGAVAAPATVFIQRAIRGDLGNNAALVCFYEIRPSDPLTLVIKADKASVCPLTGMRVDLRNAPSGAKTASGQAEYHAAKLSGADADAQVECRYGIDLVSPAKLVLTTK